MDRPVTTNSARSLRQFGLEVISLQTARGRLATFGGLSSIIFCCHYHWLDHLSLWGHFGLHWAPSIGLTRAYWLILHGQLVAAWHRNPLIYLVLSIGLPLLAADTVQLIRRHQSLKQNLL